MKLHVAKDVAEWYRQELDLDGSTHLRYYVRYGFGGNIPGFSLAIREDTPNEMHAESTVNRITFFIEASDAWYFEDKDLHVQWNSKLKEPEFHYQ